jgi:quinolinate synthase
MVPEKNFIFHEGYCPVHNKISKEDVQKVVQSYPEARILVHPECTAEVVEMADYVGSTSGIVDFADKCPDKDFIVCTEQGIVYQLEQNNPQKRFHFTEEIPICQDMKKITLDKIEHALLTMDNKIELDEPLRDKAEGALEKMHEIAR